MNTIDSDRVWREPPHDRLITDFHGRPWRVADLADSGSAEARRPTNGELGVVTAVMRRADDPAFPCVYAKFKAKTLDDVRERVLFDELGATLRARDGQATALEYGARSLLLDAMGAWNGGGGLQDPEPSDRTVIIADTLHRVADLAPDARPAAAAMHVAPGDVARMAAVADRMAAMDLPPSCSQPIRAAIAELDALLRCADDASV